MTTIDGLELNISPKDKNSTRLLPEECAYFDVKLSNTASHEVEALDLDANSNTPVYSLYNSSGQRLAAVTHQTMINRFSGGGMGEPMEDPPALVKVPAGHAIETSLDLWNYIQPPGKGIYDLAAAHLVHPGKPEMLESNRLRFEIVDARVRNIAFGYEDIRRGSSLLLWVAVPEGGGQALALARLSTIDNHRVSQWSGNPLGPVDPAALLAVAGKPPEGTPNANGWFAILDRGHVEIIHHFRTDPRWRSPKISLPVTDPRPVPGFPDRVDALFLATGATAHGAALAGVPVASNDEPLAQWSVPLQSVPRFSACAFNKTGPVSLLLASTANNQTRLSRIDVDADGKVVTPEHTVRTSPHQVLALVADQRPQQPQEFVVLEADPEHPDHLFVVRIPLTGEPKILEIPNQPGWPVREGNLAHARTVDLQIAWDGKPVVALTDDSGRYYMGRLDGSRLMHLGGTADAEPMIGVHVSALRRSIGFGAFNQHGNFVYLGGVQ